MTAVVESALKRDRPERVHRSHGALRYRVTPGLEIAVFDHEVVVYDPHAATVHHLGPLAGAALIAANDSVDLDVTDLAAVVSNLLEARSDGLVSELAVACERLVTAGLFTCVVEDVAA